MYLHHPVQPPKVHSLHCSSPQRFTPCGFRQAYNGMCPSLYCDTEYFHTLTFSKLRIVDCFHRGNQNNYKEARSINTIEKYFAAMNKYVFIESERAYTLTQTSLSWFFLSIICASFCINFPDSQCIDYKF